MTTETVREYVSNACNSSRNSFGPAFFEQHLSVVVKYARSLGEALEADLEIVELAAWLHEIARKMLSEKGYPAERTERVAACIASHSAPVQIGNGSAEEVCVSNADATAQIVRPAYWLYFAFHVRRLGFTEGKDWLRQRVENNWAALIPPARAMIEKEYRQVTEFLRL